MELKEILCLSWAVIVGGIASLQIVLYFEVDSYVVVGLVHVVIPVGLYLYLRDRRKQKLKTIV